MVTSELGACEWFVWDLRRSNLIERGQLDLVVGEFLQKNPLAEPPALASFLVEKKILTNFQSERLLQGKTQGFVLGPFTLMDAIGSGSMGTVYKAQSKTDGKMYAVKVLPRRSMWNVRIARRKVRAFEQCRHPSVVPFVDVGTAGSMHYLAWPFVAGETLNKVVEQQGKIKPSLAAYYAVQIAEGLDLCHQQGLFHGLIKPSNIMIGEGNEVYILDFGIGCLLAETEGESLVDTMSTSNSVTSGLDFASPESIMDPTNLTPAGDQYSLGCLVYYMLTGQLPFPDGSVAEKMMAHQLKEPTPIGELTPDVPAELLAIVDRLMKKAPDQRFGSVAEMLNVLRPLVGTPSQAPREAGPSAARGNPNQPASWATPADRLAGARGPLSPLRRAGSSSSSSVSISTQTPKPMALGSLPTRSTLRGEPPAVPVAVLVAPTAPTPEISEQLSAPDDTAKVVPTDAEDSDYLKSEEKLGTLGITISALTACTIVFLFARILKLF